MPLEVASVPQELRDRPVDLVGHAERVDDEIDIERADVRVVQGLSR